MDKIILDINGQLLDGDILMYKGGQFVPISIDAITEELYKKIGILESRVATLEARVGATKQVLDLLIKGENE